MTESDLIQACIAGDSRAQRMLYDQYAGKMLAICQRYCSSMEEAEDAFQEGFVKVYSKIREYKFDGAFGGWIRRIMVNTALDIIRKNKKHRFLADEEEMMLISSGSETPLDVLSEKDLLAVLNELPSGYRLVFNLYAIEGYNHKEIGEQLGITESTSKSQYLRAKKHIQKKLEKLNF